jgi:phage-related tail fiber protein
VDFDSSASLNNGAYHDGDEAQGIPASIDSAKWMNAVTNSLINILVAGGETPDIDNHTLVLAGIQQLIAIAKAEAKSETKSELIDTAPGALDTLNELAAALGDDANFSATVTASLATKINQTQVDDILRGWIISLPVSTPPAGMIEANGALLLRADYPDLWTWAQQANVALVSDATWLATDIGAYSSGDGSTTFRVPETRGEFIRGFDNGRGVDSGRTIGSAQDYETRYSRLTSVRNTSGAGNNRTVPENGESAAIYVDGHSISGTYGPRFTNTPQGSETRGRSIALMHCIKY